MVDFKKKLSRIVTEKNSNPLELYTTLDRKSVTGPLRPAQTEILEKWYTDKREEKDLIIKLHTGEGKTLIGLLILFSKLNSTSKPCLFICPNKYLVEQVSQEAKKFGIPFCLIGTDLDLPNEFLSGKKILITHVQKLFNGKSRFGLDNNSTPVGSIILDDSHACIDSIRSSFTIKLLKDHPAYQKILTLFKDDLRNQGEGSFLDMESGNYETLMPIPYWSWIDKKSELTRILSEHQGDDSITFVWPIIRDHIDKCQAFISGSEIEITPYLIPLGKFGSFTQADQRILMSATTQDDSFFIKGLSFSIDSVKNPLTIKNQKWSGEKMLLLPSLIDESLDRTFIINKFAPPSKKSYGIISLVPSFKRASLYSDLKANVATNNNTQCTKLPKRIIQRSEYQDAVDINDNNIKQSPQYYKRRQAICEHPFGTIKRHFGFTHTLLKGLQKVNGEMNLIMFCYNFIRTKNILGFKKMLQAIQNWQPDYSKVVCALKKVFIKCIYNQNEPLHFLPLNPILFLKTA